MPDCGAYSTRIGTPIHSPCRGSLPAGGIATVQIEGAEFSRQRLVPQLRHVNFNPVSQCVGHTLVDRVATPSSRDWVPHCIDGRSF
jgi:hypothetical protein